MAGIRFQLWDDENNAWAPAGTVPPSQNRAPVADLTGPTTGEIGNQLTFDASGSFDPDGPSGDPITKTWSLTVPTGSTATLDAGLTTDSRRLVPDITGFYEVSVEVEDDGGASRGVASPSPLTDTATITATVVAQPQLVNRAPTATLSGPTVGTVGTLLTYTPSSSDPDSDPITYSWALTKPASSTRSLIVSGANRTLTPDVTGSYTVTLTATDDGGAARGVVGPVALSDTDEVTTSVSPVSGGTGPLGEAGLRQRLGMMVDGPEANMPALFATQEASIGRTISRGDPIRFVSDNLGHFNRVPGEIVSGFDPNSRWIGICNTFASAWASRQSTSPAVQCQIIQLFGVESKTGITAAMRVARANDILAGKYDAKWRQGWQILRDAFGADGFIPRMFHEPELTNTTGTWGMITAPGNLTHVTAMHNLSKRVVEHQCRIAKEYFTRVAIVLDGAWKAALSSRSGLSTLVEPYRSMKMWEWILPDDLTCFDILGTDLYASPTRSLNQWVAECGEISDVAESQGKETCLGEWGVFVAKQGVASNFTDVNVRTALGQFFDVIAGRPTSGPGAFRFYQYFNRAPDGGAGYPLATDLATYYPQSWTYMKSRLGNP